MTISRRRLVECITHWEELRNVTIDEDENIDVPFLNFPIGTFREDIWHWFEYEYEVPVAWLMHHIKELEPEVFD